MYCEENNKETLNEYCNIELKNCQIKFVKRHVTSCMHSEIIQRSYFGLIIHYVLCTESKQNYINK